ncbi:MAG: hypothetical protein II649_01990 [Kiritimatiellae bacterium]|nr:hypothetical protein [Kiritimatiellia bacterium]
MNCVFQFAAAAAVVAAASAAEPVGFREQCRKQLWVTYRSFNKELERTGQFAAMGITNRCFFAANTINSGGNPYCEYPLIWKGFKKYDWSALDAQAEDLLKASPDARFMVMIDLNTPYWATHKFHLDSFTDITHAGVMPNWRDRTREWMLDFIAYAEKRWGDRIGCYILSGGGTSEWYEYDRGRTSYAKTRGWQGWCKARGLSLGEEPPSPTALGRAAFENLVYDPATEPEKIAYWKFHNSITANAILFFAKAARKAIPKTKEIGVFFGYYLTSCVNQTSFAHLDYERVYASPDIDFFIAPGNYSDRAIGGGAGSQLVYGTALRYGKRFLHEIDFGPHDQTRWGRGLWKTLEDDLAGNTREAAFAMANNANYWWFDMWGGFYRNPKGRERIAALKKVQDALSPAPSVAEILLVCDSESLYHVNEKCPLERAFGQHLRNKLGRIAAPYDIYSFGDMPVLDMNRYKLVCLNSTLLITPERAKFLREKVCANGRTVLWCYAPGVTDGKSLDVGRVEEWAGVPFKTPGVSATQMDGWRSVYAYDYKLFTPESLTKIASDAGVHLYLDKPATVFAKEGFLAVHLKDGGEKTIRLPRKAVRVVDLLAGATVAENADSFTVLFGSPDTRLFKVFR